MIKSKVMDNSYGQMVEAIREHGKMVSKMDVELIEISKDYRSREHG